MNDNVNTPEAAPVDAINVYYTQPATVGQQVATGVIGTLVPIVTMAAGFLLFAATAAVVGKVQSKIAEHKASKGEAPLFAETAPTE